VCRLLPGSFVPGKHPNLAERLPDVLRELDRACELGADSLARRRVGQLLRLVVGDVGQLAGVHARERRLGPVSRHVLREQLSLRRGGRKRVDTARQLLRAHRAATPTERQDRRGERHSDPRPHRLVSTRVPNTRER
jgi:hypothetical protein